MTEQEQIAIGKQLAEILFLKKSTGYTTGSDIRWDTSFGNKTALGLFLTVKRVLGSTIKKED